MFTRAVLDALSKFYMEAELETFMALFGDQVGMHLWGHFKSKRIVFFFAELDVKNKRIFVLEIERIATNLFDAHGSLADDFPNVEDR